MIQMMQTKYSNTQAKYSKIRVLEKVVKKSSTRVCNRNRLLKSDYNAIFSISSKFLKQAVFYTLQNYETQNFTSFAGP